jgi:hypothetical protein
MGFKGAALRLSMSELGKLIGLPDDHSVIDIIYKDADRMTRTVSVVIEGPSMYDNYEKCEIPWVDLRQLYERTGDPNKITTTLSFDNVFTITYKGESLTTEFPLTLGVLSKLLAFLANPHAELQIMETE